MGFDYAAKIAMLLANANDESLSDDARQSYYDKAAQLMAKYRIEESEALATDPAAAGPIDRQFPVSEPFTAMHRWYTSLLVRVAEHAECRVLSKGNYAVVVGYESDVRYAELLWTGIRLAFVVNVDPVWDDTLTEAENVFRLRAAGIQRRVIADRAWGNGHEAAARSKVQRIYRRECAARGVPAAASGLGHNTDQYREAYASAFYHTIARRLDRARDAADSVRGGVVLHGRADAVDEAFYALFPYMRPSTVATPYEAPAPCAKCAKAKSGACNEHAYLRVTQADRARWDRAANSSSARAGASSGRAVAESVDLGRATEPAARVTAGPIGELA